MRTANPTQCDLILEALLAAAGEWVPMPRLAEVSGSLNVHTRVDELRRERGIVIENEIRHEPHSRRHHSFYRIPA